MNLQKVQYFERIESDKHQEFVQNHSQCVLCGTVLELQHVVDSVSAQIKEEAHCPECEIRTRAKIHSLN